MLLRLFDVISLVGISAASINRLGIKSLKLCLAKEKIFGCCLPIATGWGILADVRLRYILTYAERIERTELLLFLVDIKRLKLLRSWILGLSPSSTAQLPNPHGILLAI